MKLRPIKDKKRISVIFDRGSLIKGSHISLRFYDFKDKKCVYGVSVPKKSHTLAVRRNKIKRRMREQLGLIKQLKSMVGLSFFVIYHSKSTLSSKEIGLCLFDLFRLLKKKIEG